MKSLLSLLLLFSLNIHSAELSVQGKVSKKTIDGHKTLTGNKISFKAKAFSKSSDLILSFDYLDRPNTQISITYSTSDELYSILAAKVKIRTADLIACGNSNQWKPYSVRLEEIDFSTEFASHHLNFIGKKGNISLRNIKLVPAPVIQASQVQKKKLNVFNWAELLKMCFSGVGSNFL